LIKFINVTKKSKENSSLLLSSVNIEVKDGEFVYITGPSGAGKSTVLKMIYGEKKPSSGRVMVAGKDVGKMGTKEILQLRRRIGVVFQDFKLLKKRTVYRNIAYALEVMGKKDKEIVPMVERVLEFVGLQDKKNSIVDNLSVGEKQRTALARALVNNPTMLVCDEITGNLNYEMAVSIMNLLHDLNELGTTILFSTHDRRLMSEFPRRVIEIEEGVVTNAD
jgi:cell division transport system ATP-binding protein